MDQTLPLSSSPTESDTQDLKAAIDKCFVEMDVLRHNMSRSDIAIAESGERTDEMQAEIARLLAEMKAA